MAQKFKKITIPITKPYLDGKEEKLVLEVLRSGWLTQGPKVIEFEKKIAEYTRAKYAVAVTSCTTALFLALKALEIKEGDDVIVPSFSFIATANSVAHTGATPIFADIDWHTYNISPLAIQKIIDSGYTFDKAKKTLINNITRNHLRAIMAVHQVGLPADMDAINLIGRKYGLFVMEDAACAIGSEYNGKRIGAHSPLVCFSFHPRKIITTAEGGVVTTDSKEYAQKIHALRQHYMTVSDLARHKAGSIIFESYPDIGYNFRMSDVQAAIGIAQMFKLDKLLKKRAEIAAFYNKAFTGHPYLEIPYVPVGYKHTYQSYLLKIKKTSPVCREEIMKKLAIAGIATRRGIMAIHLEPAYASFKNVINLPVTEESALSTMTIPLYPQMSKMEIACVIGEIKKCFERKKSRGQEK